MKFNILETIEKIDSILFEDEGGGDYSGPPSTNTGNLGINDEGLDLDNHNSGLLPYYGFLQSRYPFVNLTFAAKKKKHARRKKRKKVD